MVLQLIKSLRVIQNLFILDYKKMKFWSYLKEGIYKCDFFCSTEYLRYKEEPEYRTMMGGVMSITLIIGLLIVFSNKVINTLNMMSINSTTTMSVDDDPSPLSMTTRGSAGNNFMFGVEIWHHNLNDGPRMFDINFRNMEYNYGEASNNSIEYTLQPCTINHWKGFPSIQAKYNDLNMNYWLCPPKDLDFQISGKYSSMIQQTLQISVNKCTDTNSSSRLCANQSEIDAFFASFSQKIFFTIYFINPRINPDEAQFLTYYMEDQNYIIFSQTGGEEGQLMVQDFTIQTDDSISPFPVMLTNTGGIVDKSAIKNRFQISSDNTNYCTFFFYKSPNSLQISRSYVKLDQILSYIGGLFGTIAACLFIIRIYNGYSFQINLGAVMYKHEEHDESVKKYNFLFFLEQGFYNLVKLFGCGKDLSRAKANQRCRKELLKQLDVLYLLKRVSYLERAIEMVLDKHQLKGVHLLKKLNLSQAQRYRRNFKLHQKAIQQCENFQYNRKNSNTTAGPQNAPFFRRNSVENQDSLNITDQNLQLPPLGSEQRPPNNQNRDLSSQQSSDESEQNEKSLTTMELLMRLKKEKDTCSISHRIYNNLNDCLKDIIDKCDQKSQISQKEENAEIGQILKTIDFKPRRRCESSNKLSKFTLAKLLKPMEGIEFESSQEDNIDQQSIK